jgi:hypothetical protein
MMLQPAQKEPLQLAGEFGLPEIEVDHWPAIQRDEDGLKELGHDLSSCYKSLSGLYRSTN